MIEVQFCTYVQNSNLKMQSMRSDGGELEVLNPLSKGVNRYNRTGRQYRIIFKVEYSYTLWEQIPKARFIKKHFYM